MSKHDFLTYKVNPHNPTQNQGLMSNVDINQIAVALFTGLHTQKAYTHSGTSPLQILLLPAHAYMHSA